MNPLIFWCAMLAINGYSAVYGQLPRITAFCAGVSFAMVIVVVHGMFWAKIRQMSETDGWY